MWHDYIKINFPDIFQTFFQHFSIIAIQVVSSRETEISIRKRHLSCFFQIFKLFVTDIIVQHIGPAPLGEKDRSLIAMDLLSLINLKPHNRPIFFKKKNTLMADLGTFCAPMGQNGGQKDQSAAVPFKTILFFTAYLMMTIIFPTFQNLTYFRVST